MNSGFVFISEAGTSTGFGHLTRQLALTESTTPSRVQRSLCVVDDSNTSLKLSTSIAGSSVDYLTSFQELEQYVTDVSGRVVFLDGRKLNMDSLNWHDPKLAVVLSPLTRIPRVPCVGVFRGYSIPSAWSPKKCDLILLGPKYSVVPAYVAALRGSRTYKTRELIQEICAFPGQKSSAAFWQTVRDVCNKALEKSNITLWVAKVNESEAREIWRAQGQRSPTIRVTDTRRPWLDSNISDLALTTGGQSLVEALCLGIPTIAMPELDSQFDFIRRLSTESVCLSPSLSLSNRKHYSLVSVIFEKELRDELSCNSLRTIDSCGGSRIIEAVTNFDKS